jgi:hypothetical protein
VYEDPSNPNCQPAGISGCVYFNHLWPVVAGGGGMKDEALPFGVGGGLVAIKKLLSRDPCVHANTAIEMIDAILKEHPPAQPDGPLARRESLRKRLLLEDVLTAQDCEWVNEVKEGDLVKIRGGKSAVKIKSVYRQRGLAPDYYTLILAGGDTLELSGDELADLYEPAAAVPDVIHHTDLSEHPKYIEGWNDCRAEMLRGKP